MLSYKHAFHAGNLADVHKHALLAWSLAYLAQKPKPLSYIETHAGRGLYDLAGSEAEKTGEAAQGIVRVEEWLPNGHPYRDVLAQVRRDYGPDAYPGSPMLAHRLLRHDDTLQLAERHPTEAAALRGNLMSAKVYERDGLEMLGAITPPTPRRGLCLIDPSYEIKDDYIAIPKVIAKVHRKWPVACIMLWYPQLRDNRHSGMLAALAGLNGMTHEVSFPPAREGHGMIGSGLYVINPPYGFDAAAKELAAVFDRISQDAT